MKKTDKVTKAMIFWGLINIPIAIVGFIYGINTIWGYFIGFFILIIIGLFLAHREDKERKELNLKEKILDKLKW